MIVDILSLILCLDSYRMTRAAATVVVVVVVVVDGGGGGKADFIFQLLTSVICHLVSGIWYLVSGICQK